MSTVLTLTGFGVLAAGLVGLALWQRSRHRQVWGEVCRLRWYQGRELLAVRKWIALFELRDEMRLPPDVPSQNGEDLWLWEFFQRKRSGFFVEVGAYDGRTFSNTYFFEALGWTGLLVEPAPDSYAKCVAARPYSRVVHAAATATEDPPTRSFSVVEGRGLDVLSYMDAADEHRKWVRSQGGSLRTVTVPCRTLDSLLADHTGPIDFVSIDVEGAELDVLRGFDLDRFRPTVLLIEEAYRSPAAAVRSWLADRGYFERARVEYNVVYARKEDGA